MTSRRIIEFLLCGVTGLCAAIAAIYSMRWPLVGDASLMHYAVFLLRSGWAPYRQIMDINLPGSYLSDGLAMWAFGWGPVAWRVYDLLVCAALFPAALLVLGRKYSGAAFAASCLFLIIHLKDGLGQAGQRDLLIGVLLLASYGAARQAVVRKKAIAWSFTAGLLVGLAAIIKPVALLGLLPAIIPLRGTVRRLGIMATAALLPVFATALWLHAHGSLQAFLQMMTGIDVLHAELGRRGIGYLASHLFTTVAAFFFLWIVWTITIRREWKDDRLRLLLGVAVGIALYFSQGKGFPYHRYAFLAALLPLMMLDMHQLLDFPGKKRLIAYAALVVCCTGFSIQQLAKIRVFSPATPMQDALAAELMAFPQPLSRNVQCLDTFGGCLNTLYNLRAKQATGFLYDCYLFTPQQNAASRRYREEFWQAFTHQQPKIVILTSQFCFADAGGFTKLNNWPQLRDEIAQNYTLHTEWQPRQPQRWWSRPEMPEAFRIYVRR